MALSCWKTYLDYYMELNQSKMIIAIAQIVSIHSEQKVNWNLMQICVTIIIIGT